MPGTHDQLRAEAMIVRLTGQPLASLVPGSAASAPRRPSQAA